MKKIFYTFPKPVKQLIVQAIEFVAFLLTKDTQEKVALNAKNTDSKKIRVLIYHKSALSFGGTEKNLQMIAKYLNKEKYTVFLMHVTNSTESRIAYLNNTDVQIIPFTYASTAPRWPYALKNMNPLLENVVQEYNIDCIITATPGQTIYPLLQVKNVPILLINIFGSFSMQKNIKKHICISNEVKELADRVVHTEQLEVQYIPSERPLPRDEKATAIRNRFNIKDTDLVFGRIGRSDNAIFDPIALLGFEIAVKSNPNIHYIIMSPAPAAIQLVVEHKIPNVHWLEPSYLEEDVWTFHHAIDVLAHSRLDGESCGLNIIESMLVGNPILTHKSHIWNAHLEYLQNSFSLYAEKDDYVQYAENMITYSKLYASEDFIEMRKNAKETAERLFLIENIIHRYEEWINEAVK